MQIFFRTIADIKTFRSHLHMVTCPECRRTGTMIRYGYIYEYARDGSRSIRRWRVRCSESRNGCRYTPSVALSETIPHHCFSASALWRFILALKNSRSVLAAWNTAQIGNTVDTGYRTYKRLLLCQSRLRTNLMSRAPPPESKEMSAPLFQVFDHLKENFGKNNPISKYQEYFQESLLITS